MLHVFVCVRESAAPWSIGEHVTYSPFDTNECVLHVEAGRFFDTEMIPAVRRDVHSGALQLVYDVVEDEDMVEFLTHERNSDAPDA